MARILSAAQAKTVINNEKQVYVIDLRSEREYRTGHIAGSLNIPLEEIENITSIIPNCGATILLYCQTGKHSRSACVVLMYLGYRNVWDIGGVKEWPYGLVR